MPQPSYPLDSEALQDQALAEVGDPNGTLAPRLEMLWDNTLLEGAIDPRLHFLYLRRSLLHVRLAEEQASTDFAVPGGGVQDRQSARFDHLQAMLDETNAEITARTAAARANRSAKVGALTAATPETPLYGGPDATDPRYRGDPYVPGRTRPPW